MLTINLLTREELLSLPIRDWQKKTKYSSILILPRNEAHDSGWNMMYIIGCDDKSNPIEIAANFCDDIEWVTTFIDKIENYHLAQVRNDCCMMSGAMHFWCVGAKLEVGEALSSVEIRIIKESN